MKNPFIVLLFLGYSAISCFAQSFKVIAFFTGKNDQAHISFVKEANRFFPKMAKKHHFTYDTTSNWDNLRETFLANYQVVLFLDTGLRNLSNAKRLRNT
ncbi:MAG: hypothetical protein R2822_23275 [Spirosomataceae bacterium]